MDKAQAKTAKRDRRHNRIRAKVQGTAERPRLAIFRSNTAVYAQLVNDEAHATVAASDSRKLNGKNGREKAAAVGADIAAKAKAAGVTAVVFDRGGFQYTGAIKDLAEAAREAGLTF